MTCTCPGVNSIENKRHSPFCTARLCDGCGTALPAQMARVSGNALCVDCANEKCPSWKVA